jgi:hypothetical protein
MRSIAVLFLGAVMLSGCALWEKPAPTPPAVNDAHDKMILTPETILVGKVVRVNYSARYAVLNFPVGSLPAVGVRLNVYRRGLKVGEVKITGPQQEDNTVGDIASGEVDVGDELRGN